MSTRTAVILTTYVKTSFQREMLNRCITSVVKHINPNLIIVLDDDHSTPATPDVPDGVHIMKTLYPQCGEVNAYAWACAHTDEFDRFVFLHDSTIVLGPIPLDVPDHFRPLWYTSKYISDNVKGGGVEEIIHEFKVKGELCLDLYQQLVNNRGSIVFGGMAIFDAHFAKFLAEETNFLVLAHKFNTRHLRCFFERVMYIIYCRFCNGSIFNRSALCGDIFHHKYAFQRNRGVVPEFANNPYVLKVWQGR